MSPDRLSELARTGAVFIRRHEAKYADFSGAQVNYPSSVGARVHEPGRPKGAGLAAVKAALTNEWQSLSTITRKLPHMDPIHVSVTLKRMTDRKEARRKGAIGAYEWRKP